MYLKGSIAQAEPGARWERHAPPYEDKAKCLEPFISAHWVAGDNRCAARILADRCSVHREQLDVNLERHVARFWPDKPTLAARYVR